LREKNSGTGFLEEGAYMVFDLKKLRGIWNAQASPPECKLYI